MARTRLHQVPLTSAVKGAGGGRSVNVEDGATKGAVIGVDLVMPDGSRVRAEDILNRLAQAGETPGELTRTLWRLIREIPANVDAVAKLDDSGFVRRQGEAWSASPIANADLSEANTSGLSEGGNLYFTDERARAAGEGHFFSIDMRFAELPDESAVVEARTNLGLQNIDGGTFN